MSDVRIRKQIALLAARMMYERSESEYFAAKRKAARQLGVEYRFRPGDLPSNKEIREQIGALAAVYEGPARNDTIRDMRLAALRMMRLMEPFRPRLIGSVLTGHVRQGSDIDLHLFTDHISAITTILDEQNLRYQRETKRIIKRNEERYFTHLHVSDLYNFEFTVYGTDKINYPFKSSITGRLIERASIAELEQLLQREHPGVDLDADVERLDDHADRFELYRMLLEPLAEVKQHPTYHPEGDALYHSLQVFQLATYHAGYDEEFVLAALLHDVGKAIDPADHVTAGLQALEGAITERTEFLIAHHMDAHEIRAGTLGHRAKQRLQASPDFDDLMMLEQLDIAGRKRGVQVCSVGEATAFIRQLSDGS